MSILITKSRLCRNPSATFMPKIDSGCQTFFENKLIMNKTQNQDGWTMTTITSGVSV